MSDGEEYREVRRKRGGVEGMVHRSVPIWNDTKVMVYERYAGWRIPSPASDLIEWLSLFPPEADVQIDDDENYGEVTLSWTEDATDEDIAKHRAAQEREAAEAAERAEYEAWKAERDAAAAAPDTEGRGGEA